MYHSQEDGQKNAPNLHPVLSPWDIHIAKVMQTLITLGRVGDRSALSYPALWCS